MPKNQFLFGRSLHLNQEKLGSEHTVKLSKGTRHQKKFWRERVHRDKASKSVRLIRLITSKKSEEREFELIQEHRCNDEQKELSSDEMGTVKLETLHTVLLLVVMCTPTGRH